MVWGDIIKVFDRKQTLLIRTSIGTYDSSRLVSNPSLGQRIKLGSMRANALCQDWHSAVLVRLQFDVCQKSSRVGTLKTGAAESENNRRDDSLNPLSLKPLRWYPDSNEILLPEGSCMPREAMSWEELNNAKTWIKRRIQECAELPGECCNHKAPLFYMVPFHEISAVLS